MNFNQIPNDRLTPFAYVEFDNSRAVQGPGILTYVFLIIGQRISSGSIAAEVPKLVSSVAQAEDYWGRGSQIADMFRAFKQNNESGEVWGVALDDSGAAASADFAFSGTATEAGEVVAYFGGHRVAVTVEDGDTAANIVTNMLAELADSDHDMIPANFSGNSGTLHVVQKNAGDVGNDFDCRLNYYDGEALPAGISCSITASHGGSGAPDIQDALDAIGDTQYHVIIHPYTNSANLEALEAELEDRWGPLNQNDGMAVTFKKDSYADLVTLGSSRNSAHSIIVGDNEIPTSPWAVAAAVGAVFGYNAQIDPARPFQTLRLYGVLQPETTDKLTSTERNILLRNGIATLMHDRSGGVVRIERLVTTYQLNPFGTADTSYRDATTVKTLSYLRWDWRNFLLNKYPRHKLADDGTRYAQGQAIMTPKLAKSEAILKFTQWESLGLVEGLAQFKRDLVVERNEQDPNRLDILLPTDLVNQLIISGTQIQFLL